MATYNLWLVEEMDSNNDGVLEQRQSVSSITVNEDGGWNWTRPDDRLAEGGVAEWDRVMNILKNVNGEDLRHIVCATGLMDHCNDSGTGIENYVD
jgi:hypothetical protein